MFKSKGAQAAAEGGLYALGMTLVLAGMNLFEGGETVTGAVAVIAGGVLIIANRYVKLS